MMTALGRCRYSIFAAFLAESGSSLALVSAQPEPPTALRVARQVGLMDFYMLGLCWFYFYILTNKQEKRIRAVSLDLYDHAAFFEFAP